MLGLPVAERTLPQGRGSESRTRVCTRLPSRHRKGASSAQSPEPPASPHQNVIQQEKDLEKQLGFEETRNFESPSAQKAFYRCYYTGKLELPASYDDLGYKRGNENGCEVDTAKYDVFFYPVEAVGSGKTPVTSSLSEASLERVLVVVPHEDFHQHAGKLPPAIPEAAATLVGFLTAGEFAKKRFGADSSAYRKLVHDPAIFLEKANLVNSYYDRLAGVYRAFKAHELTESDALARKERLFVELRNRCGAISPNPGSFNKCLAASNNAGLAFDATYTRYYPLVYSVHLALGQDLGATVEVLKRVLSQKSLSEREALEYLENLARRPGTARTPALSFGPSLAQ